MSRAPSRLLLTIAACAALAASLGAAPDQPEPAPGNTTSGVKVKQDEPTREERAAAFRERMRERCVRIISEMREDQVKLEEALKKFDAGGTFDEIRPLLPERLVTRFRGGNDGSPDGDAGPGMRRGGERGSERGGGGPNSNQPFNDQDWEAVDAIIKHAQPEMLDKFNELRQKDAEQAQKSMLAAYPRLRFLLELYKHDRSAFDLRLEELLILRKSLPLAKEVIDLKKAGKADDSDEVKAAREKLRDLGKRQYDNRLKIQRHELEMSRQRLQKREKDIDEQASSPDRFIERSIDGLIKMAEHGGFGGPSERRGGGGGSPDGGRRRPDDN
jgi:hypothetical protein